MIWSEVRQAYPSRWLIIEAVEAHTADERRLLDKIAVMEACDDPEPLSISAICVSTSRPSLQPAVAPSHS
jgi:hypothetical protein